ncbi:MAG: hypothetical protein LM588_00940 [Fervidicoccaceae archaeon]|nr:hypothetical protein [Fervidicoccaceae archaeon]
MSLKTRRGLSVLVLGFIVLAGLALALFSYRALVLKETKDILEASSYYSRYIEKSASTQLSIRVSGATTIITNQGTSALSLKYVFYVIGDKLYPLYLNDANSNCTHVMSPLQNCVINQVLTDIKAIVTSDGVVIKPDKREVIVERAYLVKMSHLPININTTDDLSDYFGVLGDQISIPLRNQSISNSVVGNITYVVEENEIYRNANISGGNALFGALLVGQSPRDPSKYNLLVVMPNNNSPGNKTNITINNNPLLSNTTNYIAEVIRLRIDGFSGTISIVNASSPGTVIASNTGTPRDVVGPWYYGALSRLALNISGTAESVVVIRGVNSSVATSIGLNRTYNNYYPYLFVGDIDRNGLIDVVLLTEDASYGNATNIDDRNPANQAKTLVDYSSTPLRLYLNLSNLTGDPAGYIDGAEYQGIVLYTNMLFHDNVFPDNQTLPIPGKQGSYDITEPRDVARILLVDESGNAYIARTVSISELYLYHRTIISNYTSDSYAWKTQITSYILLPPTGKYRVAIELQDPYLLDGTRNDADITIGLDLFTILPVKRE